MTLTDVYRTVAGNRSFQEQTFWFSDLASDRQFTDAFLDRLLGSEVTAEGRTFAEDQVFDALSAGTSRGEVMQRAIGALDAVAYTDPDFGRAAQRFDNRIAVAKDQTEVLNRSTTDIAFLQDIIAGVTHDPRTVELHPATNLGSGFGGGATAESMLQLTGVAPSDLGF